MELDELPPKMRQKVIAAMAKDEQAKVVRSRRVASSPILLRCTTEGCTFPATSNLSALERHCDAVKHRRYECVLGESA